MNIDSNSTGNGMHFLGFNQDQGKRADVFIIL